MNTREFVKIGEDEQNIVFNEIDKEDELQRCTKGT